MVTEMAKVDNMPDINSCQVKFRVLKDQIFNKISLPVFLKQFKLPNNKKA